MNWKCSRSHCFHVPRSRHISNLTLNFLYGEPSLLSVFLQIQKQMNEVKSFTFKVQTYQPLRKAVNQQLISQNASIKFKLLFISFTSRYQIIFHISSLLIQYILMNTEEKKSVRIAFFLRPEIHLCRCQPGAGAPPCYTHSFPAVSTLSIPLGALASVARQSIVLEPLTQAPQPTCLLTNQNQVGCNILRSLNNLIREWGERQKC